MSRHVAGPFDVTLGPLVPYNADQGANLARMSLDKRYHGGLDAMSKGEMLSTGSGKDFGGYVAIERVSGTLDGHAGTFALQHSGTMTGGVPSLHIIVVPGSGTGELAGVSGTMSIAVAPGGAHSYALDYSLDRERP